jgi:galactokinase
LSTDQYNRTYHVINENKRVIQFKKAMLQEDLQTCGNLLNDSHSSLRDLYEVSCDELNTLHSLAGQTSFIAGSRMMGGGFGGCTINLINQENSKSLSDLLLKFKNIYGYTPEVYAVKPARGLKINE